MKKPSTSFTTITQSCLVLLLIFSCQTVRDSNSDINAIKKLLKMQEIAWSNNDIEHFMEAYHESDSIIYFGSSGVRRGYQAMLNSYKERYPTKAHTGTLRFTLHDISKISKDAYWVIGEYHLTRSIGDAVGTFMIVLKRINGKWKIVGDSSC